LSAAELRRRTATPTAADLAAPTFEVVEGSILSEEYEDPASQLQWWRALCRPA
jgi:hypothetical protein